MSENNKKGVRVAFYTRVSTSKQEKDGFGLDAQKDSLYNLVDYKSIQDGWYTKEEWHYNDSLSGKDLNRPGFQKMMADMKAGNFDIIICYKLDRISRSLTHLLKVFDDFKKYGVGFHSIKENIDFSGPIGTLTLQIFGAISQFEREIIKMRTQDGIKTSAKSGNYTFSSAPYGFQKVKNKGGKGSKLEIVENEAIIIKKIYKYFIEDDMNYTQIANEINKDKIEKGIGGQRKNISNTKWYDTTIKDVLTSTANAGYTIREFKNEDDGTTEEIISYHDDFIVSKSIFDITQKKVKIIEEEHRGGERKFLLSGKIRDLETNRKFVGVMRTKDDKHSYRRKKFIKDGITYDGMEIPGEPLDDYVWGFISDFLNHPELFYKKFLEGTNFSKDIETLKQEKKIFERKINEENRIIDNTERMYLLGKISEEKQEKYIEDASKNLDKFNENILEIDGKIEKLLDLESINNILKNISIEFKDKLDLLSLKNKMTFVELLVEEIVIYKKDDGDIQVDIKFKFNPKNDDKNGGGFEPRDTLPIKKSPSKDLDFGLNGAPSRIRTHGRPRFAA